MSEHEQRNRILDVMPDGVFINSGDRISYCNPALLRMVGLTSADQLLGRTSLSVFHLRSHDVIQRRIAMMQTLQVAVPMIEEEIVHLADGTVPVEVVTTSFVQDGEISILIVVHDLRRRKELETRFRMLVDAVVDYAIYALDATGQITTWNDGAMRLYGYTMADAIGQPHSMLFSADDVAAGIPEREVAAAVAGPAPAVDAWHRRRDGSLFLGNSVTTGLRDPDDRLQGLVKVVRDLSEQQVSSAALSRSEERNKELFDCIADALFVYDRETLRFLDVNDAAVELYGYSGDEFLTMTIDQIRPVEDVPALRKMLAHAGVGREARGVWRHQTRSGAILDVEISAAALEMNGRPACLVHARDVTARLSAERTVIEAHQETQHLARMAAATAKLGGWSFDLVTRVVSWSDEVCFLHDRPAGYVPTVQEALGAFAPEYRALISDAFDACIEKATPYELEMELVSANARRFWVRVVGEAECDATGRVVKLQGAMQDISAVRESIEAIRLSEERFRLLSKATADAVWDLDMIENSHWNNEGFERLFGYSKAEVEPTNAFRLDRIHPDDLPETQTTILAAIESGAASWSAEYRFRHRLGHYVCVLDRGYILRDPTGTAVRMIGGITDLSERKRQEERIAEQAALLDEARDMIVVRDLELMPTYWNRSAARLYDFESDDGAKRAVSNLYVDAAMLTEAHQTTLSEGGWTGELRINGRGGKMLLVSSHWSLVRDKAGRPRALLIISTDITERKSLESQFIRAQRMESIGTLASGIAHDMNNILAPILGSIELLRSDVGNNPEALDTLETINICARRGANLVKQVLSFARGVEGQRMTVNLMHLVRELLQVLEDTLAKSIVLRFHAKRDLWMVTGDSTQLHQVLLNLCVNARDAMPLGGTLDVTLHNIVLDETYASMNVDAHPGPYVMVQVSDTGPGIPPQIIERIFDPFFTTKGIGKGTGLGLSTVLTIVKAHDGFINVSSEPGKGTKFNVYLPSNTTSIVDVDDGAEPTALPHGDGQVVLVVDDEEAIRKIVRSTLERFGYKVLLAQHGAEAVALYAQHRAQIAVVLTDMAMPIMDGVATIIALKAIDPGAIIIGSSGLTTNADVAKAVGAGVEHFVAKPYTAEALLVTLAKALGTSLAPSAEPVALK